MYQKKMMASGGRSGEERHSKQIILEKFVGVEKML